MRLPAVMPHFSVICLYFTASAFSWGQDLRSFSQWDGKATELYSTVDQAEFGPSAARLLSPLTLPTLRAVLSSSEYPILRLAAFYSATEKQPQSKCDFLIRLLLNTKDISLYDDQVVLLAEEQCDVIFETLGTYTSVGLNDSQLLNLQVIARAMPEAKLAKALSFDKDGELDATCLSVLVEELCKKNAGWRSSPSYPMIKEKLRQIKLAPGRPQITVVLFYPFDTDADALAHILFLLEDEQIPDPMVVLAILRKQKLALDNFDRLIADASKKDLVRRRLHELRKRSE